MSHLGLGIKLTPQGQIPGAPPFEVGYSYGGDGTYLCPDDPFHNTRGEVGFYHDTQLGSARKKPSWLERRVAKKVAKKLGLGRSIPTDFDLASTYGWVPFSDGFVAAKEGFQPGTWIPPNGYDPAGGYGPRMVPRDRSWLENSPANPVPGRPLGDAGVTDPTVMQILANLAAQQARNNKLFWLSILSTSAIVISSIVTTIRNAKLIKQERRLLDEEEAILSAQAG
jgi:hypothetical protein